jgi:regulator of nonsense transcripts 1
VARKYEAEAAQELIRQAEVVCATCVTAGGDMLQRHTFTHVLVDEATQVTPYGPLTAPL